MMSKMNKKANSEQVIVDIDEFPGVKNGQIVDFDGKYVVVDANYKDSLGSGILLEKVASIIEEDVIEAVEDEVLVQDLTQDPMVENTMVEQSIGTTPNGAQEYHRTNPGNAYHYDVDNQEQAKFEEEARETAQRVENERASEGFYWERFNAGKNRVMDRILAKKKVANIEKTATPDYELIFDTIDDLSGAKTVIMKSIEELSHLEDYDEVFKRINMLNTINEDLYTVISELEEFAVSVKKSVEELKN